MPRELDGPRSLLVGFHLTAESGLLGILRTNYGQQSPALASGDAGYVFLKGFLANSATSEKAHTYNSEEARRILTRIRERSSKHACGFIIEMLRRSGAGQQNHTASHGLGGRRCPCVVGGS